MFKAYQDNLAKQSLYQFSKLSIAVTTALLLGTQTFAESNEPKVKVLDTITVIANADDPQSTTGSAYLLSEQELEKFNSTNVNNVLRNVPGVYVREEDGLGTYPNIGIRASSSGRSAKISILEDGIPAAMSPYSNTSAYYFPNMGRINSVEILKGPEILFYGPQTTAGVINLISTPIPKEAQGKVSVEIGEFATRKIHAHYGATAGQWGFLLETYQGETDGFHNIDRSKHTAGYNIEEYLAKVRWSSAPEARFQQQLDLKLAYGEENQDVSYVGLTDADFKADPNRRYGLTELERMDRGRKSASLVHQFNFNENHKLTSTAYWMDTYRYYDRVNQINGLALGQVAKVVNENQANATLIQGILNGTANTTHANGIRYGHNHQDFEVKGLQFELNNHFSTGSIDHELTTGVRYNEETPRNAVKRKGNSVYEQVNGSLVYQSTSAAPLTKGEAKAYAAWLGNRITWGNLSLLPVIRHERIETKANLAENATTADIAARANNELNNTSLGLGINYQLTDQLTVLAGVHEGFSPPGNGSAQGVKGEESVNYEGGIRFREGSFGLDAIAFYSDYSSTIRQCLFANPCPNPVQGQPDIVDGSTLQTGSKEVYGLELGAFAELYSNNAVRVPIKLSYTYTDGEYTTASDLPTGVKKGDVLDYTPKHVGSLQVGFEGTEGWKLYTNFNYSDKSYITNTAKRAGVDDTYLKTDSLFTIDFVGSYSVEENVELYGRVENVLDNQKITHRGADGARGNAPRWISTGLKFTF